MMYSNIGLSFSLDTPFKGLKIIFNLGHLAGNGYVLANGYYLIMSTLKREKNPRFYFLAVWPILLIFCDIKNASVAIRYGVIIFWNEPFKVTKTRIRKIKPIYTMLSDYELVGFVQNFKDG